MIENKLRKARSHRCSVVCGIWLFLAMTIGATVHAGIRTADSDREALIALENDWLKNEHNAVALERILAPDFLHPIVTGDILTKTQHIQFSSTHLPPGDLTNHFEGLRVRTYSDVGIVNGLVVTTDRSGTPTSKTVFTDVFVFRDGRWQAVNAQENAVRKLDEQR